MTQRKSDSVRNPYRLSSCEQFHASKGVEISSESDR
jgi:hypothetical protein